VVWHHSLPLMNSFNKTEAAVFSCRLCFLRAFPFISLLLGPDCTNVPYSRGRETLLDYIFEEENCMHNIFSCSILDDDAIVVSTHRPVLCTLRFCKSLNDDRVHFKNPMNFNWKHFKESNVVRYTQFLQNIIELQRALKCDITCETDIDLMYETIVLLKWLLTTIYKNLVLSPI